MKQLLSILTTTLLLLGSVIQYGCKNGEASPISPGEESLINDIIGKVNADSLNNTVEVLSSEKEFTLNGVNHTIVSRNSANSGNGLAADYLLQRIKSYIPDAAKDTFNLTGENIIAVIPGEKYPERKIIICAHYDDMPANSPAPGADDNASGTAVVMEAARVLSNYKLDYTIIFALWDQEEQGLYGSTYYANRARSNDELIEAVINIDMVGYDKNDDNTVLLSQVTQSFGYKLSDKIASVNNEMNIGLKPEITSVTLNSDQVPFLKNGYNSILIIEDMIYDKNLYYHTSNDVIGNFNKKYFLKCARLAIGTVVLLASNE